MNHFKDLEPIFCSNAGHELNQSTSPEDTLKRFHNIGPSKVTQKPNVWELHDWQRINSDEGRHFKNSNNSDDLISFKDDNVSSLISIEDTHDHINLVSTKPIIVNSKYYDDLKTVFGTSTSEDDSCKCTEKVTLSKVDTLKTENRDMFKDAESCTINLKLGRVTPMKNINNNTLVISQYNQTSTKSTNRESKDLLDEIGSSGAKKSIDLVDLFENISVTPRDITQQMNKSYANIENDNQLIKTKKDNQQSPVEFNFEAKISKSNEPVLVLPNVDMKTMVLTSTDDKILQVTGNNITIKCDRTYVISPGHVVTSSTSAVFRKYDENADEKVLSTNVDPRTCEVKPEKLFANISNRSIERATEILKTSLEALSQTLAAKSEISADNITGKLESVKHFDDISTKKANNTMETFINDNEIGQPQFSKHVEKNKTIIPPNMIAKEKRPENTTKTVLKEMDRRNVKFGAEILEENHALTRCKWQQQHAAIDEFIHGRKVIMGKEKK